MTNKHFIDWEAHMFGFGYGTGEEYTIEALKGFLELCKPSAGNPGYDYRELEAKLGPTVAWLMINLLCHANVVDYGTSPRFAWLTEKGMLLQEFVGRHSVEQLCEMVSVDRDYCHCFPDHCNCEPEAPSCNNPLFSRRR